MTTLGAVYYVEAQIRITQFSNLLISERNFLTGESDTLQSVVARNGTVTSPMILGDATSTSFNATTLCIGGDCRKTWPIGGTSAQLFSGASAASGTTDVVCPPNGGTCSTTLTEAIGGFIATTGTVSEFWGQTAAPAVAGSTCVFTIRQSSTCLPNSYTNTSVTCTVQSGQRRCMDLVNSASINGGSCIQILFDEQTNCSGFLSYGFKFTPQ